MTRLNRSSERGICNRVGCIALLAAAWAVGPSLAAPPGKGSTSNEPDPQAVARIEQLSEAFASVAAAVKPAVVNISSVSSNSRLNRELRRAFPEESFQFSPVTGTGSGVIFDEAGYIVTNNHVVADADAVTVTLADGRKLRAKVVGTDPMTDLAVIKVDASGLTAARFGDSDAVRVGHFVLAIGSPFRLGHSVSHGIVSAIGRWEDIDVGIDYKNWLQTDAPINPGNSGGPLINARGEVIGLSVAIATETGAHQGVGFAIPSNTVRRVAGVLKRGEKVVRGYLGVVIQQVEEPMAAAYGLKQPGGVLIGAVGEDTPAAKAGLKQEDIVLAIDGRPVRTREQLQQLIAETQPGTEVLLKVWRDRREKQVRVRVTPQPEGFSVTGQMRDLNRQGDGGGGDASGDAGRESEGDETDEGGYEGRPDGDFENGFDAGADADDGSTADARPSGRSAGKGRSTARERAAARERSAQKARSAADEPGHAAAAWGFEAATLTPELVRKYRLPSSLENGVLITSVDPASEAWACRLRRGQVIVRADGKALRLLDDLSAVLTPAALKRGVRLKVRDRAEEYFLVLRVK